MWADLRKPFKPAAYQSVIEVEKHIIVVIHKAFKQLIHQIYLIDFLSLADILSDNRHN